MSQMDGQTDGQVMIAMPRLQYVRRVVNTNKCRTILSAPKMFSMDSNFWRYKVYADIRRRWKFPSDLYLYPSPCRSGYAAIQEQWWMWKLTNYASRGFACFCTLSCLQLLCIFGHLHFCVFTENPQFYGLRLRLRPELKVAIINCARLCWIYYYY